MIGIVGATAADLSRLSYVLAAAFADNPVSDWLFDGEQDTWHPAFFGCWLRWAVDGGRIDQSPDGTAVAVWLDRTGDRAVRPAARFDAELGTALGRHQRRWRTLDAATSAAHPAYPHWWLAFLGVLPGDRHQGHASRLLEHAEGWLAGTPAYLEATSRRLTGLYRRHGFVAGRVVTVRTGPVLHPMHRGGA